MDILLVDDSKTMRGIVQRAIRQAGFRGLTVGEAENGVQGLEKLRAEQPKLILSDWNMPEMSGIEFLVQVRASDEQGTFWLHHLRSIGCDQTACHGFGSELPDHQAV